MRSRVSAAIDTQLADLMVGRVCRRWPVLRVVPRRWIRPMVAPATVRLRRALSLAVLTSAATAGVIIALLVIWPR
jgi:hypothetical protein